MNALAPAPTSTQLTLLPNDPMQLMALAERLALARLIPPHFQKSPADCWLVMSFCRSRNLDFMMVVGECSVVQGRLFFSGKLTAALLNTSGHLANRLNYQYEYNDKDETDVYAVTVSGRLNNEAEPRTIRITLDQVKTNNKMWTTQPEQQLAYAGARTWGRRHAPEVLMGLLFEGETIDITPNDQPANPPQTFTPRLPPRDVTPNVTPNVTSAPNVTPNVSPNVSSTPDIPKLSNELLTKMAQEQIVREPMPFTIERHGDENEHWGAWASELMEHVRRSPDAATVNDWTTANADSMQAFEQRSEKGYAKLISQINAELNTKGDE
jgi:hypothetical protein